jgi:hypothetical protein
MKRIWFLLVLLSAVNFSCNHNKAKRGLPFGTLKGTRFTEVRRAFSNGLTFNKEGYQLEPSWKMYFVADDSVMAFSPKMKRYYGFHVYFDHDSIFNMVDAWLKVKKIDQDSLVFEALKVENRIIKDDDAGFKLFVTYYSDRYINKKGAEIVKKMGMPSQKDTLFIKSRSQLANTHLDSAFAARQPVILKSKSKLVKVEKVKNVSTVLDEIDPAQDYLSPEYNIDISKAYEDFDYSFYVFVDDKGVMHFRKSTVMYSGGYKETYEKVMKGIIDGYLQHYLEITPGNTLGIAHNSIILLNVVGKKN